MTTNFYYKLCRSMCLFNSKKQYWKKISFIPVFQIGYSQHNFYEEWYSTDTEHLPQNSVKSIIPDKYGLVRFDGKDFKVFNRLILKQLLINIIHYWQYWKRFFNNIYRRLQRSYINKEK